MKNLRLKYHSEKVINTVDMNTLFSILVTEYGKCISLDLIEMNESERKECTRVEFGIEFVDEAFRLFEVYEIEKVRRRKDLEEKIVNLGQK